MRKYTHLDTYEAKPKNNSYQYSDNPSEPYDDYNHPQQSSTTRPNYTYHGMTPYHQDSPTERPQYRYEASTPQSKQKNTTQRTLNERCRTDRSGISPSQNGSTYDERQPQKQMQSYIYKLKDLRNNLEKEIKQLQRMLDNTSKFIAEIDYEYEQLKIRIMDYTSRSLDQGFKNYKKAMPRWSKYEEVEKRGLKLLLELDDYIDQQTHIYEEAQQGRSGLNLNSNLKELVSRTAHYNSMVEEIRKVREECEMRHPTIKEERVEHYETALVELCAF